MKPKFAGAQNCGLIQDRTNLTTGTISVGKINVEIKSFS